MQQVYFTAIRSTFQQSGVSPTGSLIKLGQSPSVILQYTRNKYLLAHGLISKTTLGSLEALSEALSHPKGSQTV